MKKLLFVDDKIEILNLLKEVFSCKEDYEIHTVQSGIEALNILENEKVDLIMSDLRRPEMSGFELLKRVKDLYPDVIRVAMSSESDKPVFYELIQKNIIKHYIVKPLGEQKLLNRISQLIQTEEVLKSNEVLQLLKDKNTLPTIKRSYEKVLRLIDEDAEILDISKEIEKDPAIAAKILHVANSAYFSAKTTSLQQAVAYIGLANTRNLVLSTSVIDCLNVDPALQHVIDKIWNHSFIANKILVYLFENVLHKKLPDTQLVAGLLHNVGVVYLLNYSKENYLHVLLEEENVEKEIAEFERQKFKITHQEAGGYILEWLGLPYPIIEVALYHSQPNDERIINKELVYAAHIAIRYAFKLTNDITFIPPDDSAFEYLKITKEIFENSLKWFKM